MVVADTSCPANGGLAGLVHRLCDRPLVGGWRIATYLVPVAFVSHCLATHGPPTLLQLALLPATAMSLIGVAMSVCLHRFFSHQAFQTSRPVAFLLGCLGCLAYQSGPLWWAVSGRACPGGLSQSVVEHLPVRVPIMTIMLF